MKTTLRRAPDPPCALFCDLTLPWTKINGREYDFYTFTNSNATVTTYVSPSNNGLGADRPLGFAVQIDSGAPQSNYFFPPAAPGQQPAAWDGNDGFVANSIIAVPNSLTLPPGAHTLKVCFTS
jgi:hypothetical protein